jgi:acetolactate synthase-1/2/3 large subunit
MGYAIPAILGAFYAGKKNIIAVVGDGSFMMNMQELLTISANHIPVKIFVINNNMYAVIRKRQKDLFRTRTIGNDPSDGVAAPDFKKIAESFGFAYKAVCGPEQLEKELEEVLEAEGAWICEVSCVEDQKYLHTSFAINEARKLVKRPLEDLAPFMDRELFYSEMVVAPLDE